MAEPGKVKLVRCPKCENVLPELQNFSVYQCGGCGAVLRGNLNLESDAPPENSGEERKTAALEDLGTANVSDVANGEGKSCGSSLMSDGTVLKKNGTAHGGIRKLQGNLGEQDLGDVYDSDARGMTGEIGDLRSPFRSASGRCMLQPVFDSQATRAKTARCQDYQLQNDSCNSRLSTSQNRREGPSCLRHRSFSHIQGMPSQRPSGVDRKKRVQFLEDDRAELLRKIDELKDQLSRSCDVAANPREKAPSVRRTFSSDSYKNPGAWVPNEYSSSTRASTKFQGHETHASPCSIQNREPYPFPACRETPSSQIHGTARAKCHLPLCHPYDRRPHNAADSEIFEPFPHQEILHHIACSCSRCYKKHHGNFPPIQSAAFCKNQFPDFTKNQFLYHQENPISFGSHYHNMLSTVSVHNFSHHPECQTRLPNRLNSVMGGSLAHFPQRGMALASGAARARPIAGGAPIIACCHCFELLQLPNEILRVPKLQQRIQCGACSAVINYKIVGKKLLIPFCEEAQAALELEGFMHSRSRPTKGTDYTSNDFNNSGYEFHGMDRMPVQPSANNDSGLSNALVTESLPPSSLSMTNDENNLIVANSLQGPFRPAHSLPPPGSLLQEHFDYSNNLVGNRHGKGNKSSRSDHEKALPSDTTVRQNSSNEASLATDLEVSYNDYSNARGALDSGDGLKEDDQPQLTKWRGESFLANFIRKSFKDFARSNQAAGHDKTSVSVNGHPVPAHVIKKAEKVAGPIHPGNYWYDTRAGFWGVMGGPCLGIIPPSIEEFNYPMLENCAAGNTRVFVNGRELHKEDLDMLATRGLPTHRNRSYVIEIAGRVWDEDTGEELDCLGKLAPTVEEMRHGFGMKVPRAAAC